MKSPCFYVGAVVAASLMAATIAVAQPAAPMGGASHGASHGASGAAHQMHQKMMSGMQSMQSMKPAGDVDKDFATMMRMHHQQAVDMAKVELEHGKSAELKSMARKMIDDQQKEIAQLDKWLAARK